MSDYNEELQLRSAGRREELLKSADALALRDNERARDPNNANTQRKPNDEERKEIEADVKAQIECITDRPRSTVYFDPMRGHVSAADEYKSETNASVKDVIWALKTAEPSNETYDAVERLLYKYSNFVRQGIRENIANHKGVSWYLTEDATGRAFISYQDGPAGEWLNDCYADEVPLWLLIFLFNRIARRKKLGDQTADETIARVKAVDAEYVSEKQRLEIDSNRGRRLNIRRNFSEASDEGAI